MLFYFDIDMTNKFELHVSQNLHGCIISFLTVLSIVIFHFSIVFQLHVHVYSTIMTTTTMYLAHTFTIDTFK